MTRRPLRRKPRLCERAFWRAGVIVMTLAVGTLAGGAFCRPASADSITIDSVTLPLNPEQPRQSTLGRLLYLGGLELSSNDARFGGLSGLRLSPDGTRLIALTDQGDWLSARLVRDGEDRLLSITDVELAPIADPNGGDRDGRLDAEALTRLADGGLAVGFEGDHRIVLYAPPATDAGDSAEQLARWRPKTQLRSSGFTEMGANEGIESLATMPDGRLLAIAEGSSETPDQASPAWLIDPVGGQSEPLAIARSDNFRPTDATWLGSGEVMVLERRFTAIGGVSARLRAIAADEIRPGALLQGRVLANLVPPITVDNMEAIDAWRTKTGEVRLLILSDDNFSALQRTILLEFALPAD
jgi:hypothetical protein